MKECVVGEKERETSMRGAIMGRMFESMNQFEFGSVVEELLICFRA